MKIWERYVNLPDKYPSQLIGLVKYNTVKNGAHQRKLTYIY